MTKEQQIGKNDLKKNETEESLNTTELPSEVGSSNLTTGKMAHRDLQKFSEEFQSAMFQVWYAGGEPTARQLFDLLTEEQRFDETTGCYVQYATLNRWITGRFSTTASVIDQEFAKQMDQQIVQAKMEMVNKHIAKMVDLQERAWDYIEEKGLGNSRNALTALFKAMEYEREARGLPVGAYEKISKKSDQELVDDFRELIEVIQLSTDENPANKVSTTRTT